MNITIIGYGWLGVKLGESLAKNGHTVYGSTRDIEKHAKMKELGMHSFIFNTDIPSSIPMEIKEKTELLILTIPPIDRQNFPQYGSILSAIVEQFSSDCHVIFTSSTGVYPSKEGTYTEKYSFLESEHSSIYIAEQAIQTSGRSNTILRLGGLFGEDRHPIHSLIKKGNISNPQGKINFVHRSDIIRFVEHLIAIGLPEGIYNVVYPDHPDRIDYYSRAATFFQYPIPTEHSENTSIRIISSEKCQIQLGFSYTYNLESFD